MWISSITIENFRSIGSLEWNPRADLNVLFGENNVGKSSIFAAIQFLAAYARLSVRGGETQAPSESDYRDATAPVAVKCTLSLTDQEAEQLIGTLAQPGTSHDDLRVATSLLRPLFREPVLSYSSRLPYLSIRLERLVTDSNGISARFGNNIIEQSALTDINNAFSKLGAASSLTPDNTGTVRSATWNVPSGPTFLLLRALKFHELYRVFREYRARPTATTRNQDMESSQGGRTASVLVNLLLHPDPEIRSKYGRIQSEFVNFFPSLIFEAVEMQPGSGGSVEVQLLEKVSNRPLRLDNSGSGVAELLTLLTNLVAQKGSLIVVEEPETHFHPHLKRRLHRLILASARDNQIFIVTHDPHFVEPGRLDALARVWLTPEGTKVKQVAADLSDKDRGQLSTALKSAGQRETLFARAVLLVEDESQANVIRGFARTLSYDFDAASISIIPVGGHTGFPPYEKLLTILEIPYLCLRDLPWDVIRPTAKYWSLGAELEEFLKNHGLSDLLEAGQGERGESKQRAAAYVGERTPKDRIPQTFKDLLQSVVKIAQPQI